jgi:hypothetical protein
MNWRPQQSFWLPKGSSLSAGLRTTNPFGESTATIYREIERETLEQEVSA